jgi:hypothetical protein
MRVFRDRHLLSETNPNPHRFFCMKRKADGPAQYPDTPDGRYFVVRGRLWRKSDPGLSNDERDRLVNELMSARRAVRDAGGERCATLAARKRLDAAKVGLGERGPVWWNDGAPDYNRHMVKNTPYIDWFAALAGPETP